MSFRCMTHSLVVPTQRWHRGPLPFLRGPRQQKGSRQQKNNWIGFIYKHRKQRMLSLWLIYEWDGWVGLPISPPWALLGTKKHKDMSNEPLLNLSKREMSEWWTTTQQLLIVRKKYVCRLYEIIWHCDTKMAGSRTRGSTVGHHPKTCRN